MEDSPGQGLTPRRRGVAKPIVALGTTIVALILCEAAARIVLRIQGTPYSGWETVKQARGVLEEVTGSFRGAGDSRRGPTGAKSSDGEPAEAVPEDTTPRYSVHPYTGYGAPFGYQHVDDLLAENAAREEDDSVYTVLYLGGSVAVGFSNSGAKELERHLRSALDLGEIRRLRFAVPGFKQPQQLTQLAYLMSIGIQPDLVVNLDGLNEVRIPEGNVRHGLRATFPSVSHWLHVARAGRGTPIEDVDVLMAVRSRQLEAASLAERVLSGHLHYSAILGRYMTRRMNEARARWAAAQEDYVDHLAKRALNRPAKVPDEVLDAAREASIECWYESSITMHHLCEARGIRYIHLLQPTLHDPGSKPISREEQEVGIGTGELNRDVVEGYPLLREGIARLRSEGVEAYDMTAAFSERVETLYVDSCHLNLPGNILLARAVVSAIGLPLLNEPPALRKTLGKGR